jgi:hypothetical protein
LTGSETSANRLLLPSHFAVNRAPKLHYDSSGTGETAIG